MGTFDREGQLAGLERHVDVGIRLTPSSSQAPLVARALARILDDYPMVPVRIAGLGGYDGRVHLTVAITLGTLEQVKTAAEPACAAVRLVQSIVDRLTAYDPCFVELPDARTTDAARAASIPARRPPAPPTRTVGALALIG